MGLDPLCTSIALRVQDVLEELISDEIIDESDIVADNITKAPLSPSAVTHSPL